MKKVFVSLWIIFMMLWIPFQVQGASEAIKIFVANLESDESIDILIHTEDNKDKIHLDYVNPSFLEHYGDLTGKDILTYNESNYVSYSAYYTDAFVQDNFFRNHQFAEGQDIENFKIVLFNDEGDILFVSDVISRDKTVNSIFFDAASHEVEIREDKSLFNSWPLIVVAVGAVVIIVLIKILIIVSIEIVFASFIGIKKLKHIVWINFITQFFLYIAMLNIKTTPILLLIELFIISLEFFLLVKMYPKERNNKLFIFVLVGNILTYILTSIII